MFRGLCCHIKISKIRIQAPKYVKKNYTRKFNNVMRFICHTLSFRQDVTYQMLFPFIEELIFKFCLSIALGTVLCRQSCFYLVYQQHVIMAQWSILE